LKQWDAPFWSWKIWPKSFITQEETKVGNKSYTMIIIAYIFFSEEELAIFLQSSFVLSALELFLNTHPAITITFAAIKLATFLVEVHAEFFSHQVIIKKLG
jgi:hypothetical protein